MRAILQGSKSALRPSPFKAVEADKEKGSTQRRAARLHVLYPYFPERAVSAESKLKKKPACIHAAIIWYKNFWGSVSFA